MKQYILILAISILTVSVNAAESSGRIIDLVEATRSQIGQTLKYDPSYRGMGYPNGDVPIDRGVCKDVIIRAMRDAYDYDLQKYVHEDMKKNFHKYPQLWGLKRTDQNIDHRRVPNLQVFFERKGWKLPLSSRACQRSL